MTSAPLQVVLVDDHHLFRAGVRSELGGAVEVLGEAADVPEAVDLIDRARPTWSCSTSTCPAAAAGR